MKVGDKGIYKSGRAFSSPGRNDSGIDFLAEVARLDESGLVDFIIFYPALPAGQKVIAMGMEARGYLMAGDAKAFEPFTVV